jgi:hypothetical protein
MNMWEEALHHERVLRDAVSAVDAARAAGDAGAEATAVAAMHTARDAQNQFLSKLRHATSGELDEYRDRRRQFFRR